MVSQQAAYLFGFAVALVFIFTAYMLNSFSIPYGSNDLWPNILWGIFGVLTPLGLCFLLSGMHKFEEMRKIRTGDSTGTQKFAEMALRFGLWWGATIYFFVVYLPIMRRTFTTESIGEHVS